MQFRAVIQSTISCEDIMTTGMLTLAQLKEAVAGGMIDTVVAAFPDMQGRLMGKRFHAQYFIDGAYEETHGCDYLLANDVDMEPVPGYKAASWEKGYGDFVLKPDLATIRATPWLDKTALVLCDVLDHHTHEPVAHSPPQYAEAPARPAQQDEDEGLHGLGARILPVR
jgi:glutamine synthetase